MTHHGERVLVVDDNQSLTEATALALDLLGFETRVAHDGLTALQLAAQFRPHAVLIDLALPALDGFEVARRLRALPIFGAPRLVAWTGRCDSRHRAASQAAGFDAFLVKPASPDDVCGALFGHADTAAPTPRRTACRGPVSRRRMPGGKR